LLYLDGLAAKARGAHCADVLPDAFCKRHDPEEIGELQGRERGESEHERTKRGEIERRSRST
jgi:hypothetical protein